jgi:hypothetical protein
MRMEVGLDGGVVPDSVQAQLHHVLTQLPSTVELVVNGQRDDGGDWRTQFKDAAVRAVAPPGHHVVAVPGGYVLGRADEEFSIMESARRFQALDGAVIVFLDPSTRNATVATDFLAAVRPVVTGQVLAHLDPSAPMQPARAARTAGRLHEQLRVPTLIDASRLATAPLTTRFVPYNSRGQETFQQLADFYLVVPPGRRAPRQPLGFSAVGRETYAMGDKWVVDASKAGELWFHPSELPPGVSVSRPDAQSSSNDSEQRLKVTIGVPGTHIPDRVHADVLKILAHRPAESLDVVAYGP